MHATNRRQVVTTAIKISFLAESIKIIVIKVKSKKKISYSKLYVFEKRKNPLDNRTHPK